MHLQKRQQRRRPSSIFQEPPEPGPIKSEESDAEDNARKIPEKRRYQLQAFAADPIKRHIAVEGSKIFRALILADFCILGPEAEQHDLAETALALAASQLQGNPVDRIDGYLNGYVCVFPFLGRAISDFLSACKGSLIMAKWFP